VKVNEPDLVLFVGEALVGNEAVDQLVKFNQAMADHSSSVNPHLIDGIVLTKFDTIDDKVTYRKINYSRSPNASSHLYARSKAFCCVFGAHFLRSFGNWFLVTLRNIGNVYPFRQLLSSRWEETKEISE